HEGRDRHLLLDCGFSERELAHRLANRGLSIASLDAILITHEHGDHLGKAPSISSKHQVPLWSSFGTLRPLLQSPLGGEPSFPYRRLQPGACYALHGLTVEAVAVPHDASEPVQFIFSLGGESCMRPLRLGVLTDLGHASRHVIERYKHLDALVVETNHDVDMLELSSYPAALKKRVGGDWGHLSNLQSAKLLTAIDAETMPCVVAAHLSRQNNHPDRVRSTLHQHLGQSFSERLIIAEQDDGFDWQIVKRR
ncbi:MAG: MBL fold metallo-hydrolase, partial [Betaproteobacteria bacterium]|nr:MBL fold metallo-hydrolase [Betaproteobacteria bacterium]